jgi:hypothetical protein
VEATDVCGEILLKGFDLATEEKHAAVKNLLNGPINFGLELVIMRAQLYERYERSHQ